MSDASDPAGFYAKARQLEQRGEPFVTAVVVRVEPPTSAQPGDRALVTRDGELYGWVGGSCSRPLVIEEARKALREGTGRLLRLSSAAGHGDRLHGLTDLEMTCYSGGTMEIFVQPELPRPRLLVAGNQPVAQALAALGSAMGYEVLEIVPAGSEAGLATATGTLPGAAALAEAAHPLTFVVVATHGESDEVTVEHALHSPAPYVGLVASAKRAGSIRAYLRGCGLADERLAALHSPAGLDIKARQPEEIALSILAEIVAVRRGLDDTGWGKETEEPQTEGAAEREPATPATAATSTTASGVARDPICGMEVQIAGAAHTYEHAGATYYFCCGGCRARFATDPAAHLSAQPAG